MGSDDSKWGKEKALEDFRDPGYQLRKLEVKDRRIFIACSTAVVTGTSLVLGHIGEDHRPGTFQFMKVRTRIGGAWKILAVAACGIKNS